MREELDTNDSFPDRDIPDGEYDFKIESIRRLDKNGKRFYAFKVEAEGVHYEQVLFPNNMKGLLKVLGCTETLPGKYDWDPDLMEGKTFHATIKHETDKKGNLRQQMVDFKEADVPF
jgi:hypothetical protein